MRYVGSARTEAELGLLLERARRLMVDADQSEFDFEVEPTPRTTPLVPPVLDRGLFTDPEEVKGPRRVVTPRVVSTSSRVLFDVLAGVYSALGFDIVDDVTFRDLVIARIVEPTSVLDTGRVLADLGQRPASEKTMHRTLGRAQRRGYRDQIATACFEHVVASGDVSLCLY